jgi:hypothetical protein
MVLTDDKVFPEYDVLGWYSNVSDIQDSDMHIHTELCMLLRGYHPLYFVNASYTIEVIFTCSFFLPFQPFQVVNAGNQLGILVA